MADVRDEELFSPAEAAMMLGCSVRTLQRMKTSGAIDHYTVGTGSKKPGVRFSRAHIEAFRQRKNESTLDRALSYALEEYLLVEVSARVAGTSNTTTARTHTIELIKAMVRREKDPQDYLDEFET